MRRHLRARRGLVALGALALAPAAWGIAELAPDEVGADAQPDYLVHPLRLSPATRATIAISAVAVVIAAAFVFAQALRRHEIRRGSLGVVVPLAAVAGAAGVVYSVITAPVIGANIGGGIALMAGIPFAAAMLGLAASRGWRLWRSDPK